jgi:hypothetical protein
MKIKIVNGTYGHRPLLPNGEKSKYIVPVNHLSLPIEVDAAEAERLIRLGVAVKVTADEAHVGAAAAPDEKPIGNTADNQKPVEAPSEAVSEGDAESEGSSAGHVTVEELETHTVSELKAMAQEMGIETGKIRSKSGVIEAIMAFDADHGDVPPALSAQDVID